MRSTSTIVAVQDVVIAHGLSAHLQDENVTVADNIAQGDAFRDFGGFYGITGSDASGERQSFDSPAFGAWRQHVQ